MRKMSPHPEITAEIDKLKARVAQLERVVKKLLEQSRQSDNP